LLLELAGVSRFKNPIIDLFSSLAYPLKVDHTPFAFTITALPGTFIDGYQPAVAQLSSGVAHDHAQARPNI